MRFLPLLLTLMLFSCSQRFYIVRHAEKAVPNEDTKIMYDRSNPPLSDAGVARAAELKKVLGSKKIRHVFSTNYTRTISTAQPLADARNIRIQLYNAGPDSLASFIGKLNSIRSGNVLIVGHSNTVDDLISKFSGTDEVPADLADSEYDNLFIVTKKKGVFSFERKKYGTPSPVEKR
jgi:broad specificity phosphatase PhoE